MANRILTWFIPGGLDDNTEQGPRHFVSEDSEIVASQVSAERAPEGTFTYDILDDDVSIMSDNPQSSNQATYAQGQVEYTTLDVSTFAVSETILGASSGSTAIVEVDNAIGSMRVSSETGAFTVGETITGQSSSATGVVGLPVGLADDDEVDILIAVDQDKVNDKTSGTSTEVPIFNQDTLNANASKCFANSEYSATMTDPVLDLELAHATKVFELFSTAGSAGAHWTNLRLLYEPLTPKRINGPAMI
ncbi:hypothetical protein LCGC14_2303450, partial [marine sediment metagenome]